AGALAAAGVRPGDRVACIMANCRELVEFYIACSLCGAISVALNTMSKAREVQRIFDDCTPSALIVQPAFKSLMTQVDMPASVRVKLVTGADADDEWGAYDAEMNAASPLEPSSELSPQDPAVMIYSSGTTGLPKGILLSHQGVVDNALCTT